RRHLVMACEASLRRLQTDWIDLFQLHRAQADIPIDETLRALDDLIRAGKVRYIGTSMFPAWKIVEALWAAKELGLNRFVCEQPTFHLLDRTAERELLPAAQSFGVAVIPWGPLCGGALDRQVSARGRRRRGPLAGRQGQLRPPRHRQGFRRHRGGRRAGAGEGLHALPASAPVARGTARRDRSDYRAADESAAGRQPRRGARPGGGRGRRASRPRRAADVARPAR